MSKRTCYDCTGRMDEADAVLIKAPTLNGRAYICEPCHLAEVADSERVEMAEARARADELADLVGDRLADMDFAFSDDAESDTLCATIPYTDAGWLESGDLPDGWERVTQFGCDTGITVTPIPVADAEEGRRNAPHLQRRRTVITGPWQEVE